MRTPPLGAATVTLGQARPALLLRLLFALLALAGGVQRASAVPFSSLSPAPSLRNEMNPAGRRLCVVSASGLGISSITAADLTQYSGGICSVTSGTTVINTPVNGVDLRSATQRCCSAAAAAIKHDAQ